MTTIVFDGKTVAADSRRTYRTTQTDTIIKIIKLDSPLPIYSDDQGTINAIAYSGSVSAFTKFHEQLLESFKPSPVRPLSPHHCIKLYLDDVHHFSFQPPGFSAMFIGSQVINGVETPKVWTSKRGLVPLKGTTKPCGIGSGMAILENIYLLNKKLSASDLVHVATTYDECSGGAIMTYNPLTCKLSMKQPPTPATVKRIANVIMKGMVLAMTPS